MEEIRKAMSPMDLKTIKNSLQRSGKFSKEIIELICDDLNFGLTKAETEQYSLKNFDITQMRVYSNCLRKGYNNEVIDVITEEGLDGHQMEVAFEFYEKGIPLSTIKEITARKENTAYMMKQMLLEAVSKTQEVILNESSNNKEFTEQIQKVFDKAVQSIQKTYKNRKIYYLNL